MDAGAFIGKMDGTRQILRRRRGGSPITAQHIEELLNMTYLMSSFLEPSLSYLGHRFPALTCQV